MSLYKQRYRVASSRLPGWDYSSAGWYFVTLCTKRHVCYFGDIVDAQARLSEIGEIVADEWQRTAVIRPSVTLDEWVVMPNHLHGILVIEKETATQPPSRVESALERDTPMAEGTGQAGGLKPNSLGAIVGQVKSACTKRIRSLGYASFDWQPRFHDRIIRDEAQLRAIREYVVNNPAKWELDEYFSTRRGYSRR